MGDQEVLQEIVKELKRIANALEGRYAISNKKKKDEIKETFEGETAEEIIKDMEEEEQY